MSEAEPIIRNWEGIPAVRGTRLTVLHVMDHHLAGRPAPWIAEFYRISTAEAEAAIQYIDQHLDELMPRYQSTLARNRQGNPPHVEAKLAGSHEKLMRRKAEIEREREQEARNARAAG